jgi:hypothetical protein
VENVENFLKRILRKSLSVFSLWKTCGKLRGFFHRCKTPLKVFHRFDEFSTGFPQSYPQKMASFPQAKYDLIKINLKLQ